MISKKLQLYLQTMELTTDEMTHPARSFTAWNLTISCVCPTSQIYASQQTKAL